MRIANNVMVFDSETVGDFGKPLIHDFAYQVIDKDFNVLVKRNWIVREIFETKSMLQTDFYEGKRKIYNTMLFEDKVRCLTWKQIIKQCIKDMKKYKVAVFAAYNVAFDYRAINGTMSLLDYENYRVKKFQKYLDSKRMLCIWNLACETIMQDEKYKETAKEKGWVSEKGNIQTNAEVCYKYITNNDDFVEDHTAMSDVEIETELLKHILQNYKGKIEYGMFWSAWMKVNKKGE